MEWQCHILFNTRLIQTRIVGQTITNRDSAHSQVASPTGTGLQAGNIWTTAQENLELLWNVNADFYSMLGAFQQEFRKIYDMIIQLKVGRQLLIMTHNIRKSLDLQVLDRRLVMGANDSRGEGPSSIGQRGDLCFGNSFSRVRWSVWYKTGADASLSDVSEIEHM